MKKGESCVILCLVIDMICNLCPRKCGAVRTGHSGKGFCKMGTMPVVARIAPHFGEEPCISGTRGSGAVFFSGCTMKCVFCQNYEISQKGKGVTLTPKQLADGYKMLEEAGVHNINLVTADHFVEAVAESLSIYRPKLPIVYNCSGYTSPKTLTMLSGLVDVYLPDFKYADDSLAKKLSSAPDYTRTATTAIQEMLFQVGKPVFDGDGMIKKGVIVRHLILPAHTRNSIAVLEHLDRYFKKEILTESKLALTLEETMLALSISAASNPAAAAAVEQLRSLRNCECHLSHIPAPGDEGGFRKLGMNLTCDPVFSSKSLFDE